MAEEPNQTPADGGADQRWEESEDRFWKTHQRRQGVWRNLAWLVAGIGLAILLNQLGCSGFVFT